MHRDIAALRYVLNYLDEIFTEDMKDFLKPLKVVLEHELEECYMERELGKLSTKTLLKLSNDALWLLNMKYSDLKVQVNWVIGILRTDKVRNALLARKHKLDEKKYLGAKALLYVIEALEGILAPDAVKFISSVKEEALNTVINYNGKELDVINKESHRILFLADSYLKILYQSRSDLEDPIEWLQLIMTFDKVKNRVKIYRNEGEIKNDKYKRR